MPNSTVQYLQSIVCSRSIIDSTTNTISLIDVIEEVTVQTQEKVPQGQAVGVPMNLDIVTLWKSDKKKEDEKIDLKLEIIDPSNKVLNTFNSQSFSFPKDKQRMRYIIKMSGFGVTVSGTYLIRLSYKGLADAEYKEVDVLPIEIKFNQVLPK